MKIKSGIKKLLSSKIILYTVAFVAVLNIIVLITKNDFASTLFLLVLIAIIHFYNKNMIIVLGGSLLGLYIVQYIVYLMNYSKYNKMEGLENNSDTTTSTNSPGNTQTDKTKDANHNKTIDKINKNALPTTSSQGLVMAPLDPSSESTMNTSESNAVTDESFEVGRTKKNSNGYNIDYASTVEDAYDELNKILGSDGIKRLTNDTQNLMKQQLQLAESMKSMKPLIDGMTPLMEQAKGLLGNMGDNGNLNNLANMAKQFTASLGNTSAK